MAKKKSAKKSVVKAMQVNLSMTGEATLPDDLPTLEKNYEVARARFNYSIRQKVYWENEEYRRVQALNEASLAYLKKKHGLTDEELRANPPETSHYVWTPGPTSWLDVTKK